MINRYEKILGLSIYDMANFLSDLQWDSDKPNAQQMLEWLIQPYTKDKNDTLFLSTDNLHGIQPNNQKISTDEISDGYHTFGELYHHRAILFSVICNEYKDIAWKSKRHNDGSMYDGMFIVGINTPNGQATYHYDIDEYWGMFDVKELEYAPEWDGHSPSDAIKRIYSLKDK